MTYLYSYPRMSICNNHNDSFSIIFCTFEINIKSLDSCYKLIKNAIQSCLQPVMKRVVMVYILHNPYVWLSGCVQICI